MGKDLTNLYVPIFIGDVEKFRFFKEFWTKVINKTPFNLFLLDKYSELYKLSESRSKEEDLEEIFSQFVENLDKEELRSQNIVFLPLSNIEENSEINHVFTLINEFKTFLDGYKNANFNFYFYPIVRVKKELTSNFLQSLNSNDYGGFIFTDMKKNLSSHSFNEWMEDITYLFEFISQREGKREPPFTVVFPNHAEVIVFSYIKREFEKILYIKLKILEDFKKWLDGHLKEKGKLTLSFSFDSEVYNLKKILLESIKLESINSESVNSLEESINYLNKKSIERGEDFLPHYEASICNSSSDLDKNFYDTLNKHFYKNYKILNKVFQNFLENQIKQTKKFNFIGWGISNLRDHTVIDLLNCFKEGLDIKMEIKREVLPKFEITKDLKEIINGKRPDIERKRKSLLKAFKWNSKDYIFLFLTMFILIFVSILGIYFVLKKISFGTIILNTVLSSLFSFIITFLYRKWKIKKLQESLFESYLQLKESLLNTLNNFVSDRFEKLKNRWVVPFLDRFKEIYLSYLRKTLAHFEDLKDQFIILKTEIEKISKKIELKEKFTEEEYDYPDWYKEFEEYGIWEYSGILNNEKEIELFISKFVQENFKQNPQYEINLTIDKDDFENYLPYLNEDSLINLSELSASFVVLKNDAIKDLNVNFRYHSISSEEFLGLMVFYIKKYKIKGEKK